MTTLTAEEFEQRWAEHAKATVSKLREFGRYPEPCTCGQDYCQGWGMAPANPNLPFEDRFRHDPDLLDAGESIDRFFKGWELQAQHQATTFKRTMTEAHERIVALRERSMSPDTEELCDILLLAVTGGAR